MAKKLNRYVMSYNLGSARDVVVYAKDLDEAKKKFENGDVVEEEPSQVKITIVCDRYHIADSLRELANVVENEDIDVTDYEYEDSHCCATFTEE